MKKKTRIPLTPLDVCTLMAHEAAALLNVDVDAVGSAEDFRDAMGLFSFVHELRDADTLLAWADAELDSARQFAQTGRDSAHLIAPDRLLLVPTPAMQMDAVWMLFQTAVQRTLTQKQRQTLLELARLLTDIAGLEDMLLTTEVPAGGFLTAKALRAELEDVRTALQGPQTDSPIPEQEPA